MLRCCQLSFRRFIGGHSSYATLQNSLTSSRRVEEKLVHTTLRVISSHGIINSSVGQPTHAKVTNQNERDGKKEPADHFQHISRVLDSSKASPQELSRAALSLCDIMEQSPEAPVHLFWKLILQLQHEPPARLRDRIVAIISTRLTANEQLDTIALALKSLFIGPRTPHPDDAKWVTIVGAHAFSTTQPLGVRWENLVFLAAAMVPTTSSRSLKIAQVTSSPHSQLWRSTIFLFILKATLREISTSNDHQSLGALITDLQGVAAKLWETWLASCTTFDPSPPDSAKHAALMNFFQVAGWLRHEVLLHECFKYAKAHNLFDAPLSSPVGGQAMTTLATYAVALAQCRDHNWQTIFHHIRSLIPPQLSLDAATSAIVKQLTLHQDRQVQIFHAFMVTQGHQPSPDATLQYAITLVHDQNWLAAVPFLADPHFTRTHTEKLLVAFLRFFQTHRLETVDPVLGDQLATSILKLYSTAPPHASAKFPIRYFLKPLIAAGIGGRAVEIISAIFAHDKEFFTQRCVRRYMVQLVHQRRSGGAVRLLLLFKNTFTPPGVADLERKLAAALSQTGAHGKATRVLKHSATPPCFRTGRERMMQITSSIRTRERPRKRLKAEHRQWKEVARFATLRVMSILNKLKKDRPSHAASVRFAVAFLVKHGRLIAARRVYAEHSSSLPPATHAAIGNIILKECFQSSRARRLRQVLYLYQLLAQEAGFRGDRVTVNLVVNAWMDAPKRDNSRQLRSFFDLFVKRGYPAGRWADAPTLPFGSPLPKSPPLAPLPSLPTTPPPTPTATSSSPDSMPVLLNNLLSASASQPLSFRRHVKPLYRQFINAFKLRNDLPAAKIVTDILKWERLRNVDELERRSQAKREGIERKKKEGRV